MTTVRIKRVTSNYNYLVLPIAYYQFKDRTTSF